MPAQPPLDGLNTDDLDTAPVQMMIRVTIEADRADLVADRFWQLGVRAVSEIDLPTGDVEVSSSVGNERAAIARALSTFDPSWRWRVDEVASGPSDAWKEHAVPVRYRPGKLMVPAWIEVDAADDDLVTRVDPGSAFGLGDHPTTKGSMALLADAIERSGGVRSMLDVGCGTGVLAILAAQLGVPAVRAIDVADAAVAATLANAELNGVGGRIGVNTAPLSSINNVFDVVVANILAPVLISLAHDLQRVTALGGTLIISGILDDRHDHVLDALQPMQVLRSEAEAGWITIELGHPSVG